MSAPAHDSDLGALRSGHSRGALLAGSVGNFIEWYEFGVYGYFATIIAARFFTPEGGGEAEALVKTYASFGLAFFFRPVGAALFGRIGDRVGRRPVLITVIVLMSAATTLIGVLPTYATAGALAPWLLTFLRAVQGLSAGGEFGGAVSVMTESAPPGRRGGDVPDERALHGSWTRLRAVQCRVLGLRRAHHHGNRRTDRERPHPRVLRGGDLRGERARARHAPYGEREVRACG